MVAIRSVADRRDDARRAHDVTEQVLVIDDLIHLRAALFAERVAWEMTVPERRPPDDVLATGDFGQKVQDQSRPLERATDEALARLDPRDRPFDAAELDQTRAESAEWSASPDTIRERLEPLTERTEAVMSRYSTEVRNVALDLGDAELVAAGTTFQRSIRLPDEAAELVAALSDLWAAEPEERLRRQSDVAAQLARFEAVSENFEASLSASDGPVVEFWNGPMRMPPSLQSLLDRALAGELTDPGRAAGEPVDVGMALLDAIEWTINADSLPLIAADEMMSRADRVADDAGRAERYTLAAALAVIGLSLAGALYFGRSIVAPVRRLTRHADRLGRGELTLDPLPLGGPPDVAVASAAVNDVVVSLRLLEEKSRALAAMDLMHPALAEPLPGELGASLQRSTEVLSASIVERERLRSQLAHDATHDYLTGVANRAGLGLVLADLDATGGSDGSDPRAAVIFIDLGGFRQIRNRLGLAAGDAVLKATAERITSLAPLGSTVARLGGDEFVVVVTGAAAADALDRARAMVGAVASPVQVAGQDLRLRACAGVAVTDGHEAAGDDQPDLLQRADLAVHQAKQLGPETVVLYDDALGGRIAEESAVLAALAQALQPGSAELAVVFQPIVAANSGSLLGVESLLRWNRRAGSSFRPDQFVPIAERSDLIVQLDMWVMRRALEQLAEWERVGHMVGVSMAVNVSARTLLRGSLLADVERLLDETGVEPERLTLEVTETALVTDLAQAAEQLGKIRAAGIRVAIDDFGTGYTSIAQLRALPIDELKIDRSFVSRLGERSERVLVQMIQDVASHLDLITVAEGVEDAAQADALVAMGCDALQGFHFAEPLAADEVVGWARASS